MSEGFTLKGGLVSATTLNIETVCVEAIAEKMTRISKEAPALIKGMPILLDFNELSVEHKDVISIVESIRSSGAVPFAIKGSQHLKSFSSTIGLSYLGESGRNKKKYSTNNPQAETKLPETENSDILPQETVSVAPKTLTITEPVRTGQIIEAMDSDVVILSNVNPGAEIYAGGNIHVWGTLHGRAVAGCTYPEDARIFCHELNADLVCISGDYMLKDSIKKIQESGACQIRKKDGTLIIEKINL